MPKGLEDRHHAGGADEAVHPLPGLRRPDDGGVVLHDEEGAVGEAGVKPARPAPFKAAQLKGDAALMSLLRNAANAASDDDGWAPLAAIGNIITNQRPDFDSRSYGYGKLSDLIKATTLFDIERRSPGDGKQALMYAREKRRASTTRSTRSRKTAAAAG